MSRPPRPEYACKTTVYLSRASLDAVNNIKLQLYRKRGVHITAQNDAVEIALVETSRRLDGETPASGR